MPPRSSGSARLPTGMCGAGAASRATSSRSAEQPTLLLDHHARDRCQLEDAKAELAPTGVLRAGINLSNFLLVTGRSRSGEPEGVAPDMAREIAARLRVPIAYVPFPRPGELADAAGTNVWDIGLIAVEPARAAKIAFSPAYVEIEATYLVPPGSPLQTTADVDRPGIRIAVAARSVYDLWLTRHAPHA